MVLRQGGKSSTDGAPGRRSRRSWPVRVARHALWCAPPLLVLAGVWTPEVLHYYVRTPQVPQGVVDAGRREPAESVLKELGGIGFGVSLLPVTTQERVRTAERLLQGTLEVPGQPAEQITLPFAPGDLDQGRPSRQLLLAALVVPHVLLAAYDATGRDEFLEAARDVILAWARYERRAWLPRGFLWNDHAIAARVPVLAEFWRLYRRHQSYDPKVARLVLEFAARSGEFLARPSHFTFWSNHGVAQNLALWHLCVAFPGLPNADGYKRLALERLGQQMGFYVNTEGVVLEHSAGYHQFGMEMVGVGLRYLTLLQMSIPEEWKVKYERALEFYSQLRRPDGTLPVFGDTASRGRPGPGWDPLVTRLDDGGRATTLSAGMEWRPRAPKGLYPSAGYAVWWDGLREWRPGKPLAQTVTAWSWFPGHAHKHADEMSVVLWARGVNWWTGVGYWPYGVDGRDQAVSWDGSNAPHLVGERTDSSRETHLRFQGWSEALALLDLERRGPGQYVARRQVVRAAPNMWIVLDWSAAADGGVTRTTWTTSHRVKVSDGPRHGAYSLSVPEAGARLAAFILGPQAPAVAWLRGSWAPFAGWEVVDGVPTPTSALVVESPANGSWVGAVWIVGDDAGRGDAHASPSMRRWDGVERWELAVPLRSGPASVGRNGRRAWMTREGAPGGAIELTDGPPPADQRKQIRGSYERLAGLYPKFRDLVDYRWRATKVLVAAFVSQEVLLLAYGRAGWRGYVALRAASVVGWAGVGTWLMLDYFRV